MKLIIDIDEEIYNHMKERYMYGYTNTEIDKVGLAVSNGIPLDDLRDEIEEAIWEDVVISLDGTDETRIPSLSPDDVF